MTDETAPAELPTEGFDRMTVLIAGIATGLAGIFSMAAGEFLSGSILPTLLGAPAVGG